MHSTEISIQPAEPGLHFAAIASLMNTQETEPNTADSLFEWYQKQQVDGIRFTVAIAPENELLAFTGLYRAYTNLEANFGVYLIVAEAWWGNGIGSLLYEHLLGLADHLCARTLRTRVRDDCDQGIRFASRRGFTQKKHSIEMKVDLSTWDDRLYDPIIDSLREQGFLFTDMAELGDTVEARRKLYDLNNSAAATDPGSDGIPPWAAFDEFERDVCNSSWYHADGQIVAIDTHTGEWAAMSAITVFEGADHAYNLFTGTDVRYRGRKLAQAVKVLALRKARAFGVDAVRTSHNSENASMIAIDTKLGYIRTPGMLVMEKDLAHV